MSLKSQLAFGALQTLLLGCLVSCQTTPISVGTLANQKLNVGWEKQTAAVILAADIREKTSLRDNIPQFGSVYFRRVDSGYDARKKGDYDFAIQYSLAADWGATFENHDENRMPFLFQIVPGEYVIERIDIGSSPTTYFRGFEQGTEQFAFGHFSAKAGEFTNLGRLVIHMHYSDRAFTLVVEDNHAEASQFLARNYPGVSARMQTKLMAVKPRVPFGWR